MKKKREEKVREYISKAAVLFAEKGYSKCGVDELASVMGLSKGGFYWHFKSKEDLYCSICSSICTDHQKQVAGLTDREDVNYESILKATTDILSFSLKDKVYIRLFSDFHSESKGIGRVQKVLMEIDRIWYAILLKLFRRLKERKHIASRLSPEVVARQCIVFYNGLLIYYNIYEDTQKVIKEWEVFMSQFFTDAKGGDR